MTIEDANIAAFLAMKGFGVKPFVKNKESQDVPIVAWMVHGDRGELEAAIEKYYANEEVGISDFVGQLKQIRGAMYNLKKTNSYQHLPSSEDGQH